jgi:hypothetical protein
MVAFFAVKSLGTNGPCDSSISSCDGCLWGDGRKALGVAPRPTTIFPADKPERHQGTVGILSRHQEVDSPQKEVRAPLSRQSFMRESTVTWGYARVAEAAVRG